MTTTAGPGVLTSRSAGGRITTAGGIIAADRWYGCRTSPGAGCRITTDAGRTRPSMAGSGFPARPTRTPGCTGLLVPATSAGFRRAGTTATGLTTLGPTSRISTAESDLDSMAASA